MPTRTAEATLEGGLTDGRGTVALGSGAYEGPYSFASRHLALLTCHTEHLSTPAITRRHEV